MTEAHQLLKLPVVFQHFAEHKAESNSITFFEFLDMHYMHGSPMDDDYDRDMQLPFKSSADCVAVMSTAYVTATESFTIARPVSIVLNQTFIATEMSLFSSYLSNIWQPPKSC